METRRLLAPSVRRAATVVFVMACTVAGLVSPVGSRAESVSPVSFADSLALSDVQRDLVRRLTEDASSTGARVRSSQAERAEAASLLMDALADLGLTPVRHAYRRPNVNGLVDLLFQPYAGANVYASIPATTPGAPTVVVGAHYDSVPGSPGAGDNAAGVALVYGLARELLQAEVRPVTAHVVFFDQEEDNAVGSQAFADHLRTSGDSVHSVHVTDLAGWDREGTGVIEIQSPTSDLELAYRAAAARLGIDLRVTSGASSDNASFLDAGYPTVGVFGQVKEVWHQPTDTPEHVDFGYLESMTRLILDVVLSLDGEVPDAR